MSRFIDIDKIIAENKSELLFLLHNYAKEVDQYELGLPVWNDFQEPRMEEIVSEWLEDIYLDHGE